MTFSYTTTDLVEAELRTANEFSATTIPTLSQVEGWIEEISAKINSESGRIWGCTQYTETIDYNGEDAIPLQNSPIISVDEVLYSKYPLGSDNYSLTTEKTEDTDYTVYLKRGLIVPLTSNWNPNIGMKRIKVTYTAGYNTIPETIKMLATKMVAHRVLNTLIYNHIENENVGGSVSVGSINIVEPADYGVKSYEVLKSDIERLKKDLTKNFGIRRYNSYGR